MTLCKILKAKLWGKPVMKVSVLPNNKLLANKIIVNLLKPKKLCLGFSMQMKIVAEYQHPRGMTISSSFSQMYLPPT